MAFLPERFPPLAGKAVTAAQVCILIATMATTERPCPLPSVARKSFNCRIVTGEEWKDSLEDHCLGNAEELPTHTLSTLSLIGLNSWGSGKEAGRWDEDTNQPFRSRALPAECTIVEMLRKRKAGPWLCLAGHRVNKRGFADASCTNLE